MRFFATRLRIHRAGEGAPYTRIKPAGIQRHFLEILERRRTDPNDVAAGRALVTATSNPHCVEGACGKATEELALRS